MTTPFIETPRFPDELAAWAQGGRGFRTITVETYGGDEYRTAAWGRTRGEWDVANALRQTVPNAAYNWKALRNYFRACFGQLYAFRFKDFQDFTDDAAGVLGTTGLGVTATTAYQMFKNYTVSPLTQQDIIQKPVQGSIKIFINGVQQTTPGQYSLDYTTGIVTFVSQPTVGAALTWTGEYDVPVRFASDIPQMGLEESGSFLNWQDVRLMQVRNL
jgi:uncharacterized protein (TIGR02217 family)